MTISLENIQALLGNFRLEVNLEELKGNVTGVFGPSGAGKTSLLEVVAGIRKPVSGLIRIGNAVLTDTVRKIHVPIEKRAIGYVPQDLALFPHLSVRENILFGARANNPDEYSHIVEVLEISGLLSRGITNLSGGERQRVTFARALLAFPRLLLLDEPLGSLDRSLKNKLIQYLLRVRSEFKIPMLYVSHDAEEILQLCEEVIVLQHGRVVGRGPASILKDIPEEPRD